MQWKDTTPAATVLKRISVALLMAVIENGVSCMFQHTVLEKVKRLTETNSIQPVSEHRQLRVSLQAKKYQKILVNPKNSIRMPKIPITTTLILR